jgi:ribose transport system permease protein/L-arabinose transport system permease protein
MLENDNVTDGRRATIPESPSVLQRIVDAVGLQNLSLLFALALLICLFGYMRFEIFFNPRNLINIFNAVAILGLVAMAQTIVIIAGGIDISVGSNVAMASVFAALAMVSVDSAFLGVVVAIAVGALGGLFNGFLIAKVHINANIATLATMAIFKGVAFIATNGRAVGVTTEAFNAIGSARIADIPVTVIVFFAFAVSLAAFLRRTDIGRNIYAIGGNPVAARLAGIDITKYKIAIYGLAGAICGVAAVLLTARANSGQPASAASGLELEAITAAFLGGCAMVGGRGTIFGTVLGVLIIGTLSNGMVLMQVPTFYQLVAKGALLLAAVTLMEYRIRSQA